MIFASQPASRVQFCAAYKHPKSTKWYFAQCLGIHGTKKYYTKNSGKNRNNTEIQMLPIGTYPAHLHF